MDTPTSAHRHVVRRSAGIRHRLADERGLALIIALLMTVLLTALGIALVYLTNTETTIAGNQRNAQQTLYAADAAVDAVVQDLLLESDWNRLLAGLERSGFFDPAVSVKLSDGSTVNVESILESLQQETTNLNFWGTNTPVWRWYGRGNISTLVPTATPDTDVYVAVFVGDDPSETDGLPGADSNGVLTLHVEAFGPGGARKAVEVTVARTSSVEIERGFIAQRGQEELNQRARKAAVQKTKGTLTGMGMSVGSGSFQAR